eukprot:5541839-Amphidinium_carterae.1
MAVLLLLWDCGLIPCLGALVVLLVSVRTFTCVIASLAHASCQNFKTAHCKMEQRQQVTPVAAVAS